MAVISFIFSMGLSGFLMGTRSIGLGGGLFGFFFLLYYGLGMYQVYVNNNHSVPAKFINISAIILAAVCFIALILSLAIDGFNDFLGFSITYLILNLLVFVYGYRQIQMDLLNRDEEPLFASPWIFPG